MAAIIRDEFKVRALSSFISSLGTDSLYLGIARPYYWDTIAENDVIVPIPTNTVIGTDDDWEDMIALKKVNQSDTAHGIFKELWTSNVVYDVYRHDWDSTITSKYTGSNANDSLPNGIGATKSVVITSNYSIYICIKQKIINAEVQPSLYSPDTGTAVGTNTGVVKTADGYYWKLLAVTSASNIIKFSTKYYHPISTLTSAPAPSDPYYPQWENQEYSKNFKGGIYTIVVTGNGTGYNSGTAGTRNVTDAETDAEFKVIGDGVGLQYTVSYGSGGTISDIEITNPGAGYTHAQITASTGAGAAFDIIFTSMRGLGVDPIKDVSARFLLINTKLEEAEGSGDFTVENEYRKILLAYNPTTYGTSTVATASTLDAAITLMIGTGLGVGAYPIDAVVTGATTGCKARVVDFDETTGALRIIRTSSENLGSLYANNSFQVGENVSSSPGTSGGTIASIVNPEVQPYSGDIIYSEYRAPILRSPDQSESINIIVKY